MDKEALALRMVHHVSIINVIPGGMIADKLIGQKAVLVGAIVLCIGHGVSVNSNLGILYRIRTCFGVGLFKPNISTMVGGLYGQGIFVRDKGLASLY
jgi:POT family proton-dependent oligopeptide transporter